jgi:hypothetical protein
MTIRTGSVALRPAAEGIGFRMFVAADQAAGPAMRTPCLFRSKMHQHRWPRGLVIVASIAAAVSTTGCSLKAWYGGLQLAAENECRRQPPNEPQACATRLNPLTYEEYERKRSGQDR